MNPTVLIVDDSLTVRMDLVSAFETAGFRCLPCATLANARAAMAASRVDLIVLDMLLPDGDGTELLSEVRGNENFARMPILMLSSEAEVKDRILGLQTGADEYVGKPYETSYVLSRARELMRQDGGGASHKATVLIIDDSVTFRETLREALEDDGYQTLVAGTGEAGLRIAADHRPGAILVDGELPGIDGPTVIRHVRIDTALRHIPCLLLTASEDRGAELKALDAGADAFVHKGDEVEVILARLAAVLRASTLSVTNDATSSLLGPKKVLAVDDSLTYLHGLADALRSEGYDVVLARSGEEALEMLAVQAVDCILLDLLMPGIGGKETCLRIKSAPVVRDIPLIMLTALEDRSAMIEGLTAGADDYISKSSEVEVLKARVRAQIRRKQFEDENRRIREELLTKELEATEARAARELAETRAQLVNELERKNKELEAFSYSVSHDLRAPLRTINGFSKILLEDFGGELAGKAKEYLNNVCLSAQRMNELIDGMLDLSRVGRAELIRTTVDLSKLARVVVDELGRNDPARKVEIGITNDLVVEADTRLMRIALDNLLGNAWKFTSKTASPRIEFSSERQGEETVFYVRDNGSGFDMKYASNLFSPFRRLHSEAEFSGTGVGLATVHRVVDRHGGRIWATGEIDKGATMFFTLPAWSEKF
ncbi:MAG TPA: response regulator [Burkholderiales bacterium]|nr:response regulator [Burkholderiales bacterium]